MRILFDHGTPAPLRRALGGHSVATTHEMGWSRLDNGALLREADKQFDIIITTDQSFSYQQNLGSFRLAILVLPTTNWPELRVHQADIAAAVNALQSGDVVELKLG
jgi:hypothetical protein